MTERASITLQFHNVGNHEGDRIFTFHAGLNVLTGRNAIGKTNIADAAVVATSGAGRLNAMIVRSPDGTAATLPAFVKELGADGAERLLAKSGGGRKDLATPTAPSVPLDTLTGFLTGNGIADADKADAHRTRCLFELLPNASTLDEEDLALLTAGKLETLFPEPSDRKTLLGMNPLQAETAVKERANALGLRLENESREQAGAAKTHAATRVRLGAPPEMPADLANFLEFDLDALEQKGRDLADTAKEKRLKADERTRLEQLRSSLGERPSAATVNEDIRATREDIESGATTERRLQGEVQELERQLAQKRRELEAQQQHAQRANEHLGRLEARLQEIATDQARYDATLQQFATIGDLPTQDTATEAEQAVKDLRAKYTRTKEAHALKDRIDEHKRQVGEAQSAELAATKASEETKRAGKNWREYAAATSDAMGKVLARKGIPGGLTISGGRLYATVEEDGQQVSKLFADPAKPHLSDGQQFAIMLEIGISAFPGKVFRIDARWWFGELQPAKMEHFTRLAYERGIIMITCQPTDDEALNVSVYPPLEGAALC